MTNERKAPEEKEREMDEQMREYLDLKAKIKSWFIDNRGRKDDEELDDMIDELAFGDLTPIGGPSYLNKTPGMHGPTKFPSSLLADLEKLAEMHDAIGTRIIFQEAQRYRAAQDRRDQDEE